MGCSLKELLHVQVGWAHKFFAWVGFWHYCKHVVHTKLVRYTTEVDTQYVCTLFSSNEFDVYRCAISITLLFKGILTRSARLGT